jgi:hypothetical protein
MESKDLLQHKVPTPIQSFATDVKYPCTGFCYLVAINKHHVIDLYNQHTNGSTQYYNYMMKLIQTAGERKRNNPKIHHRGEYIKCETTKMDFPEIYNTMTFMEFGSPDNESFNIAQNNIYMSLMDTDIGGHIIITRSDETFIMLKLDFENFLIVDSHQPCHGTVNIELAMQYILKSGTYKGLTQIGYTTADMMWHK